MQEERIMGNDLEFAIAHVGINCADDKEAQDVAQLFRLAFDFQNRQTTTSVFSSNGIEIMKSPYLGARGHIAIGTNNLTAAIEFVESRGFSVDPNTKKYDEQGNMIAIYLTQEFGGFAVHLVQRKP